MGPENGREHRSARRSCSAARPSRSAASANSAASRLVASCCCSAESRWMRGAARRTRSRGTRSCIAFLRPVEDQTHTKVWSEGRAVQPPHVGGHRDSHLTKADSSPCSYTPGPTFLPARVICQRLVSRVSAATRPQAVLSPGGQASASAIHRAVQYGDSAHGPTPRSRAGRRRCRSGHRHLGGRHRARATLEDSAWPNRRANKPSVGAQRRRTTHPSVGPLRRAASRHPPLPPAPLYGSRRSDRRPWRGHGATYDAAEPRAAPRLR